MNKTLSEASKSRMSHKYHPAVGYTEVGLLPMPEKAAGQPHDCEPVAVAAEDSLHMLQPPKGAAPMLMRWHPAQKEWAPMNIAAGMRMGFTSAYLAAHGWTYKEPNAVG